MDKIIRNVGEFIRYLPKLSEKEKEGIFYRGHSSIDYTLIPSILRGNAYEKEDKIYLKILSECSSEFNDKMTHLDILSKMQHYGVPTRLLDITTNALVALYFACDDEKTKNENGCVYVFKADSSRIKQFDSDTVSILASIPRFSNCNKETLRCLVQSGEEYKPEEAEVVNKLLHEIKKEKPYFENIINPKDLLENYFIMPKKDNPRIIRQSGAFIIFGLNASNKKEIKYERRIIVNKNNKIKILGQLKCLGISKATLHPELYKMAEYIKDNIDRGLEF